MNIKNLLNLKTLILFIFIFVLFLIFYLPVFWKVECIKAPCNYLKEFITIFSIVNSRVEAINYYYLVIEALISLILAMIIVYLYNYFKNEVI